MGLSDAVGTVNVVGTVDNTVLLRVLTTGVNEVDVGGGVVILTALLDKGDRVVVGLGNTKLLGDDASTGTDDDGTAEELTSTSVGDVVGVKVGVTVAGSVGVCDVVGDADWEGTGAGEELDCENTGCEDTEVGVALGVKLGDGCTGVDVGATTGVELGDVAGCDGASVGVEFGDVAGCEASEVGDDVGCSTVGSEVPAADDVPGRGPAGCKTVGGTKRALLMTGMVLLLEWRGSKSSSPTPRGSRPIPPKPS